MRILIVHNEYQQLGGEDTVVKQEIKLLRDNGHTVIEYHRTNHEINRLNGWGKITLTSRVVWAGDTVQDLARLIDQKKPDVVHFHNTFMMISPAAYYPCQQAGVPVVQTLHNYRLLCPTATFFRDDQVCEDCLARALPWPAILHACYRQSRLQTAGVVAMIAAHRWLKTWQRQVDLYLTPTEFARKKLIQGGISPHQIRVKPHFVYPDPGAREETGEYMLFAGRLSPEKGIRTLLQAWRSLEHIPLKIVGNGPLWNEIQETVKIQKLKQVELLGQRTSTEVTALMKKASCLILPSKLYETFGLVAAESFACGVPVIASQLGAMAEIVDDERTGLHFLPGKPDHLATKVEWAWAHPQRLVEMGQAARQEFVAKYSAERNYELLMDIYHQVIRQRNSH